MKVRRGWNGFEKIGSVWHFAKNGDFANSVKTKLTDIDVNDILSSVTDFYLSDEAKKYFS